MNAATGQSSAIRTVPVPTELRIRRRLRRVPLVRASRILASVASHPANSGQVSAALVRAVRWQLRSRITPAPYDLRVWGDYRLRCYPRSNSASNAIYFTPYFDLPEMKLIEALVRPGDSVIDAGANIGAYSLLLASLVGPTGTVVAVEPAQPAADRLRENVRINDLESVVQVVSAAVGAEEGTGFVTADADVSNTLTACPGTHALTEVRITTLDAVAPESVRLLKLDVEGFEHEALRGGRRLLESRPIILVEVIDHMLRAAGSSAEKLTELLWASGYSLFQPAWLNQRATLLGPVSRGTGNVFAIPCEQLPDVFTAFAASSIAGSP